jgi:prophage tail gpP-like protein
MPDKIELEVGGIKIEHFIRYSINADLYTPADAFRMELANPETEITAGKKCELKINGELELTGIIDKVHRKISKSGVSLEVEGRDFMGWLVDSYCEPPWLDVQNMTLKTLTQKLLANAPDFIKRTPIDYQSNVVGKLKGKKATGTGMLFKLDSAQKIGRIEAGMTIFEVLKNYAMSRGMLFYCKPDGTLVFGRPLAKGAPEYTLTLLKSGIGNNVIESSVEEDISRRYSKVIVIGQQQGSQADPFVTGINTGGESKGFHEDATFPFRKVFVATDNNDNVSPKMRARMIMEKKRREGRQLIYIVGRHNQNNKNWAINTMCHIEDDVQKIDGAPINGDYLIYGRSFEMKKESGPITKLKLGEPGLII